MADLTAKQEAFALAYVETGNAAEAYRRAYDVRAVKRPIGFYVYCLVNDLTGQIHYFGKGTGNRMYHHMRKFRRGEMETSKKFNGIKSIISGGVGLVPMCIEDSLTNAQALRFERHLIRKIGTGNLLNSHHGQTTSSDRAAHAARQMLAKMVQVAKGPGCKAVMAMSLIPELEECIELAEGVGA